IILSSQLIPPRLRRCSMLQTGGPRLDACGESITEPAAPEI
ncbi:hypothetical protein RRG08_056628, partial [Elysia crispata]